MPNSNDIKDLESKVKKTVISAESLKRGSSFDTSKNIINVHKSISNLAGHVRKVVIRVGDLEKRVQNNSRKITSLKNISTLQGPQIRGTNIGAKLPGGSSQSVDKNIAAITESVSSIAEILAGRKKLADNTADYDRKKAEQEKRALAESKLEKRFEGLKKVAEKIIAPVKSILDRIIEFLTTVLLGRIVFKLIEWWGNPKNADKVKSIIRFLGDHWPKLLALYLTFGTSLGRFALGLTRAVARGAIKLLAKIAMLAAAKKMRGARGVARFLGGGKGKIAANVIGTGLALGGAYALTQGLKGDREEEQKPQKFAGGGYVAPKFPTFAGGGLNNFKGMMTGASMGAMFGPLGMLLGGAFGSGKPQQMMSGFVSGEKGVDKVPAMLSDGEFVMSRGAVEKYGVDTLEAMNAAGGGTNKPKIMGGKTYAASGGPIGRTLPDRNGEGNNGSLAQLRENLNNFFRGKGGGSNFDIGNPSTWRSGGGGTSVSGGGRSGGFLSGLGYLGKVAGQVPRVVGGAASEVGKRVVPTVDRAGRIMNEIQKRVGGVVNEAGKKVVPTVDRAGRIVGEVKKLTIDPVINAARNFDFGGLKTLGSNIHGAATEAVPALLASTLGISRTDKGISEDMQKALLQARQTAKGKGRDYVDYKDYAGGGFSAGALTMGRIGDKEWKRDAQGRIIGLRQVYDTNRSAEDAMKQAGESFEAFKKSGGRDISSLGRAAYKPFEALLAKVQHRGMTMHDVNFDEKVLGFKPGKEILNITQKRMIAAQKNREALQDKRPWWDKMGLFGGASAEIQRQGEEESKRAASSGQYGRYAAPSQQVKFASTKPKPKPKIKPPVSKKPKVVYVPVGNGSGGRRGSGSNPSRPKTPNFSATTHGMRSKQETLGLMR